jgi:hypothetical protein
MLRLEKYMKTSPLWSFMNGENSVNLQSLSCETQKNHRELAVKIRKYINYEQTCRRDYPELHREVLEYWTGYTFYNETLRWKRSIDGYINDVNYISLSEDDLRHRVYIDIKIPDYVQEQICSVRRPRVARLVNEYWDGMLGHSPILDSWKSKLAGWIDDSREDWNWIFGEEGHAFLVCPICKMKFRELSPHMKFTHKLNFKESYPGLPNKCSNTIKRVLGENNPGYQHGGKYSPYSKKFVGGYDKAWHQEQNDNARERIKTMDTNPLTLQYWLKEHNGNEELANASYSKAQTRDLDHFIKKWGDKEGQKRYLAKTEKWLTSMPKINFSAISQELFNSVIEVFTDIEFVYFATFDRCDKYDKMNKEYRLSLKSSFILPDFICLKRKKIIEFDGDYWHGENIANPTSESDRDDRIREVGYDILHIKEFDYNNNKQREIDKCITFLNQSNESSSMS